MGISRVAPAILIVFLSLLRFEAAQAQDEKVFRDLYLFSERQKIKSKVPKSYRIRARSNRHHLDLDEDNRQESFYFAKRDGENWIHFFDWKGKEIFVSQLDAVGPWSRLFRIQVRQISKTTKVVLLYFFEGITKYLEFQGTSRMYFLTLDNNDLSTLSLYKGPILWDEVRGFKDHYHQRKYEVSFFDLDKDKTREIAVKYGRMTRIYKYLGKGKWYNFDDQKVKKSF